MVAAYGPRQGNYMEPVSNSPYQWQTLQMNQLLSVVFVIEDDHSVRRALRRLLHSVGLQFELFGSAHEFLEMEHPDIPKCGILVCRATLILRQPTRSCFAIRPKPRGMCTR
jgi:hypothetical protein